MKWLFYQLLPDEEYEIEPIWPLTVWFVFITECLANRKRADMCLSQKFPSAFYGPLWC